MVYVFSMYGVGIVYGIDVSLRRMYWSMDRLFLDVS